VELIEAGQLAVEELVGQLGRAALDDDKGLGEDAVSAVGKERLVA